MQDRISVTLEEEDFIDALRPPHRSMRLSILALLLAFMLTMLIAALLVRYPDARRALAASPLFIGLVGAIALVVCLVAALLIVAPMIRRRAARSTLDDHPGMRDPIHYTFGADGLAVRATYAHASYPWTQLWDWRETGRVVVIMPTPRNYYVVPKRNMDAAALERLRDYLSRTRKRSGG